MKTIHYVESDELGIALSEEEFYQKVNLHKHGDVGMYYATPTDAERTIWKCACGYAVITNKYLYPINSKQFEK
jgi:hypothetical protein